MSENRRGDFFLTYTIYYSLFITCFN